MIREFESGVMYQGDCLEVMKGLPDNSIDLILCDLPYGVLSDLEWNKRIPMDELWNAYWRLLAPRGAVILTATQPFTVDLINSARDHFKYSLVWNKGVPGNVYQTKVMPLMIHEDILVFGHRAGAINYYPVMKPKRACRKAGSTKTNRALGNRSSPEARAAVAKKIYTHDYPRSILDYSSRAGGDNQKNKIHPTQKPVPLFQYLIENYSKPGDTVLDNCIGSGTTAIAAINADRRFVGIEQDPLYFDAACDRIGNHTRERSNAGLLDIFETRS